MVLQGNNFHAFEKGNQQTCLQLLNKQYHSMRVCHGRYFAAYYAKWNAHDYLKGDVDMLKALVTGASRGIGCAVATRLKSDGYEVYTPSHDELDLSSPESVGQYCQRMKDVTFDVLVNNAGINDVHSIEDITDDELAKMMEINLMAPIRLLRGVVPNMKKQRYGRIVNVGSIWGLAGKPGRTVYAASKHGIHGVTQTLAVELAPYNVLINTVCPGFTLTDLTRKNNSQEMIEEISNFIPLGRMAEPEEQALAIAFLAGKSNTYITGQLLAVDGGYTSK
jgi:3-oxoacyl-[acyl-carrier protein] reductase